MKKYRVVYIGNRPKIFTSLLHNPSVDLVTAFVVKGSLIKCNPDSSISIQYVSGIANRESVLNYLINAEFDLCVSAGCPYVLPISTFPSGKVFINSHPSVLPLGRGKHPINEAILFGDKAGATVHYMVDELDAGDIIYQKSFNLTPDIDLELLYSFIFDFESEVFELGLNKLLSHNLRYCGYPQAGETTYFSRKNSDYDLDILTIDIETLLRKIRGLAFASTGVKILIANKVVQVYSAVIIKNTYVKERFSGVPVGDAIFWNDSFILLKVNGGIIKINRWSFI